MRVILFAKRQRFIPKTQVTKDSSESNYIWNRFIKATRDISSVFQQPVGQLLALVGVTGKALFLLVPQPTGGTRNLRVTLHFSSFLCSPQVDLWLVNYYSLSALRILDTLKLDDEMVSSPNLLLRILQKKDADENM